MLSLKKEIEEAARSGECFDEVNAEMIGDYFGDDPAYIIRLIKEERKNETIDKP